MEWSWGGYNQTGDEVEDSEAAWQHSLVSWENFSRKKRTGLGKTRLLTNGTTDEAKKKAVLLLVHPILRC